MRIVVLGAGGVGSVVAGYLARAGADVVMLARPGHVTSVEQAGLRVSGLAGRMPRRRWQHAGRPKTR